MYNVLIYMFRKTEEIKMFVDSAKIVLCDDKRTFLHVILILENDLLLMNIVNALCYKKKTLCCIPHLYTYVTIDFIDRAIPR